MPEYAFNAPATTVVRITADTVAQARDALADMQPMDSLVHANGARITELSIHEDESTLFAVDGEPVLGPEVTVLTGGYIEVDDRNGLRYRLRLPTAAEVAAQCEDSDQCTIQFTGYHHH